MKKKLIKILVFSAILFGALVMLMPFAWMLMTSFKLNSEVETWPPSWTSETFSFHRDINLILLRSEGITVDFSSLTIEEFFNLSAILQGGKSEEKKITYTINDDPPYRGLFSINLSQGSDFVKYADIIPDGVLFDFKKELLSFSPVSSSFFSALSGIDEIEDGNLFVTSLMNYLFFQQTSPSTRKNLYSFASDLKSVLENNYNTYSGKLLTNRTILQATEDDSITIQEKESIRKYLENNFNLFDSKMARFTLYLEDFKKGKNLLSYKEIKNLKTFLDELFSDLSIIPFNLNDWSVLRLYSRYFSVPIQEFLNLLEASVITLDFYNSVQVISDTDTEIIFKFRDKKAISEDLLSRIEESFLSNSQKADLKKIILENDLEKTSNLYIKFLDSNFSKILAKYFTGNDSIQAALNNLKDFLGSLSSALIPFPGLEEEFLKSFSENKNVDLLIQNSPFPSNQKKIISDQYNKLFKSFSSNIAHKEEINFIIGERFSENKLIQYYTDLFSAVFNKMEIVKAPDIVKEIRYKSLNSIEIFLNDIEPIWFWDENTTLSVDFSIGEFFANVFQNYVNAWKTGKYFGYYYFNTVFVATLTTILDILFASMAAFAFSKLKFFGKKIIFMIFLSTMMIPGEVLLVPNYITLSRFGWIDTYLALIVPWTVSVFVIFLMRQHFLSIPDELYDAGRIDGISKWGFLWKIMVPLSKPVIITGALLKFVGSWNAFLWVLIVTKSPEVRTLPVGLSTFSSEVGTLYNQLMAASTFSMIPIIILFLFVQKFFIQGIAKTGLK